MDIHEGRPRVTGHIAGLVPVVRRPWSTMEGGFLVRTKRSWGAMVAVVVLALLLSDAPDLLAQAPAQAPKAVLYRPQFRVPFSNVGIQGNFYNAGQATSTYMIYPKNRTGGGGSYGETRLRGTGSANYEAATFAVRAGHGVWTMTSDARVVYTGVRIGMQDANITPMQYDVSADPDVDTLLSHQDLILLFHSLLPILLYLCSSFPI